MKYIKLVIALIVCPTIATLLAEWLKTVQWAQAWTPVWDHLTSAVPVPHSAVYVLSFFFAYSLVRQLIQWEKAKRLKKLGSALSAVPALSPVINLSDVEFEVMYQLAAAQGHQVNTLDIAEKLKSKHSSLAVEHAIDVLELHKFVTLIYPSVGRLASLTAQGRAHAVNVGMDLF